jgi:hypothetical protein
MSPEQIHCLRSSSPRDLLLCKWRGSPAKRHHRAGRAISGPTPRLRSARVAPISTRWAEGDPSHSLASLTRVPLAASLGLEPGILGEKPQALEERGDSKAHRDPPSAAPTATQTPGSLQLLKDTVLAVANSELSEQNACAAPIANSLPAVLVPVGLVFCASGGVRPPSATTEPAALFLGPLQD